MVEPDFSTTVVQLWAAQAGDRQVLDDLLVRYLPRIRKAVAKQLGAAPHRASDIDDAVQEVLLAAFRSIGTFQVRSDATFMSWLTTLVVNKVRDRLRLAGRKKRGSGNVQRLADLTETGHSAPPVADTAPSPTQVARAHELEQAEYEALIQLPSTHRQVIVYHDILGMSHAEIAPKLGYKTDAPVRALHNRARKKLSDLLRRFRETGSSG